MKLQILMLFMLHLAFVYLFVDRQKNVEINDRASLKKTRKSALKLTLRNKKTQTITNRLLCKSN